MTTNTVTVSPVRPSTAWVPSDETFGARLALIRQRMGWGNVKKAAEECGLPVQSWRTWERDGVTPNRLVTIAMSIATKTGCDYLWLVHGPDRGERIGARRDDGQDSTSVKSPALRGVPASRYTGPRVVARMPRSDGLGSIPQQASDPRRAVRQTQPLPAHRRAQTAAAV